MHGRWAGGVMTPRFKWKPNFDLSQPCPLCGHKIQPNELVRLASHEIKCAKCGGMIPARQSRSYLTLRPWTAVAGSGVDLVGRRVANPKSQTICGGNMGRPAGAAEGYLAGVAGKAHGRKMDVRTRASWLAKLKKQHSKSLEAPAGSGRA
jgi:hypothetical protein